MALALRFGLVREEHLALLPPLAGAGGRERQAVR
ncbi:serine/threonine protein kinase [Streptomyces fimicarius] [Streptomyces griseus]